MSSAGVTRVLVVEDDSSLRELYRTTLRAAGFVVSAVEDGLQALTRIFSGNPPDAVVLDLALPRVSGLDVQREIASRPNTRNIPIVVVTGTDTERLNHSDFAFVLKKPIDQTELLLAVESSLRSVRRQQQTRPRNVPDRRRAYALLQSEQLTGERCATCDRVGGVIVATMRVVGKTHLRWRCRECGHVWMGQDRRQSVT